MASVIGDLVVRLLGDTKPFKRAMAGVPQMARNVGHAAGKAILVGMAAGAAVGAAGIAGVIGLTKLASDAEEIRSKFETVFRTVKDEALGVSAALRDYLGVATADVQKSLGDLGDTFKPLGFAEKDALGLSATMTKLAGDLSSFSNMSFAEALERLQGTLIGNHENALRFGVVINEATLKAELAAMGVDKLTGAAGEQAKVLARLSLLLKGTSDAQGDLGRTSGSFANTWRSLVGTWKEAATVMGQMLLPIVSGLADVGQAVGDVIQRGLNGELPGILEKVQAIAGVFHQWADAIRGIDASSMGQGLSKLWELMIQGFVIVGDMMGKILNKVFADAAHKFKFTLLNALHEAMPEMFDEHVEIVRNPQTLGDVTESAARNAMARMQELMPDVPAGAAAARPDVAGVPGEAKNAAKDLADIANQLKGDTGGGGLSENEISRIVTQLESWMPPALREDVAKEQSGTPGMAGALSKEEGVKALFAAIRQTGPDHARQTAENTKRTADRLESIDRALTMPDQSVALGVA